LIKATVDGSMDRPAEIIGKCIAVLTRCCRASNLASDCNNAMLLPQSPRVHIYQQVGSAPTAYTPRCSQGRTSTDVSMWMHAAMAAGAAGRTGASTDAYWRVHAAHTSWAAATLTAGRCAPPTGTNTHTGTHCNILHVIEHSLPMQVSTYCTGWSAMYTDNVHSYLAVLLLPW
jgi:hypothetical protein